jgi:two-component system chemotaxis response regulator CheY
MLVDWCTRMDATATRCPEILIIDDDLELREVIAETLEQCGFAVAVAGNGREGLEYLRRGQAPRLILLDLMMPVMNGWQFCSAKQADPALASIPVIALSAAAKKDPSSPYYIDVQDVIAKPVELEQLLSVVRRVLPPATLAGQ